MPNLLLARMRIGIQQFFSHQDHPRCAETALKCAVCNESLLNWMEFTALGKTLDRQDLRAINQRSEIEATGYCHSIHQHGAAPTQTLATTFARAIETKLALQHLDQVLVHGDVGAYLATIQGKADSAPVRVAHFIPSPEGGGQPRAWRAKLFPV